jgi:putative membrane protein
MADYYLLIKAIHLIAVISWMAGMLYLPRIYVYHCQVAVGSEASEKFKVMENKLLRFIINPAMIVTWIFGFMLASIADVWSDGWFHAKLTLLIGMQVSHAMLARYRRKFANDENIHSEKFYRYLNEAPTLLMIGIVLLVVTKPF